MCAIPTASEGAPPVRPSRRLLPDGDGQRIDLFRGDNEAPSRITSAALCTLPPSALSGALMAK